MVTVELKGCSCGIRHLCITTGCRELSLNGVS